MNAEHPYSTLEPREVWQHFAALNAIPRPSGQEAAAREYVQRVAEAHGAKQATDARGNIVVYLPATVQTSAPPVAVQAHLDMVCQQRPHIEHDWNRDPIVPRRENGRIYATGTTLGADNGLGAALALALVSTPNLQHGPLELLFTVEEETGLFGAAELDPSLVTARRLINLDSEDPAELTAGCAGGAGLTLHLPAPTESAHLGCVSREIVVTGLSGGHSGVQIHEPLANAIKLLAEVLRECRSAVEFSLVALDGGTAHNAIPRDATARVSLTPVAAEELAQAVALVTSKLCARWCEDEPNLEVDVRDAAPVTRVLTDEAGQRVLDLLDQLPHGVLRMSEEFPGKVETSTNLAKVETKGGEIVIATSSRSFRASELERAQAQVRALGEKFGARGEERDGYPGWEPQLASPLLQSAKHVYEKVYGTAPQVEVIHAGLECGVLAARLPGLDAVSFGPLIHGAHTPEEYVEIATVAPVWQWLTALLEELALS